MFRNSRCWAAAGLVLTAALAGCAGLQPIVKKTATYDPAKGYVVGTFGSVENSGFGLVLTDHIGRRYPITFGEAKFGDATRDLTGMVALPPGDYRITDWMTYTRVAGVAVQTLPFPEGNPITRPFEVKPGHVVYLGRFDAAMHRSSKGLLGITVHTEWSINARPISADAVPPVIAREYPGFTAAPLECLICEAPGSSATAAAAPALPPSPAYGKKEIVLHYHRPEGDYDGWGLWAWESFEVPSDLGIRGGRKMEGDRPLAGVTWEKPLPPTGIDEFGAYWALDERNFGNGRVNYVLHRGQTRDQDGHDMFWLIRDSKEAWVNADDVGVYLSREQAQAAWKKR